ncbi:MAG: hypothetical protein H7831_11585 [Magnetococcus sp. WYHC-3]
MLDDEKTVYEVFLLILKDREGRARGVEKVLNSTIFYTKEEAEDVLTETPAEISSCYKVVRAHLTYEEEY